MKKSTTRRDFVKVAGTAGIAALAGCTGGGGGDGGGGGNGGGSGTQSRTIQQGYLLPLTGDLGSVGVPMKNGGILASKIVNNGDTPVTVETSVEDTQTKVPAAIDGANALANQNVPMMVGPATSSIEIGNRVFVPKGMLACSPSNTLPTLTDFKDNGLFYRTTPGDQYQGYAMAQTAGERLKGVKTAATTYINDDYGQLLSEWFTKHFENQFGGKVQNQVVHDPVQSSYSSILQKALSGNPDALIVISYPKSAVQLFRDYYADFDTGQDIILTDGTKDPTLPKKVGNDMKKAIGTMPAADGPSYDAFTKKFKEEFGNPASAFTAQTFDSSAITILANAAAGTNDGKEVAKAMQNVSNPEGTEVTIDNLPEGVKLAQKGDDINYKGAASEVNFDKNGDLKEGAYEIWKFDPQKQTGINRVDLMKVSKEEALSTK